MSSILDALKKLEEEKAARAATPEAEPFEPERAGETLFGTTAAARSGGGISPMAVFVGGGLFALLVACVSVAAVLWYTRPAEHGVADLSAALGTPLQPENAFSAEAAPVVRAEPPPLVPAPVVESEPEPESEAAGLAASEEQPPPQPAQPEAPGPAPTPVFRPAESAPIQEPAPVLAAAPEAVVASAPPVLEAPQPTASRPEALPRDLSTLPPLRASDEVRHGLGNITINGIREANANRPYGVAYINMDRVYVNEVIPGTRAKIIGLDLRGIAIEIVGSGERFYIRHGRL